MYRHYIYWYIHVFLLFKAPCEGDECSSSVTVGDQIFAVLAVVPVVLLISVIVVVVVIICVKKKQRENKYIDHTIEMLVKTYTCN